MKILIKDKTYILNSKEDIDKIIEKLNSFNGEIWVEYTEESKICILLNATRIYLMYLNDDSSFVVLDKNIDDFNLTEEFILSNGQIDEYPLYQTISRKRLNEIIDMFIKKQDKFIESFEWLRIICYLISAKFKKHFPIS